jgi:DNA-binding protein YbaB
MATFAELEALAAQVDREFRERRQRAASLGERTVQEEVAGGIGVVTVGLNGRLVAVELDPRRLHLLDERRLGPQLLVAVRAAEAKAEHTRTALLDTPGGTPR